MLGADDRDEDEQHEEEGRTEQARRRARSFGIIEMPIVTGTPTAIHASWRQK